VTASLWDKPQNGITERRMKPLVSVIILACNKAAYTARCLDGLTKTLWRPLEVILIDNGSTDETPALLDAFEARAGEFDI